MRILTHFMCAAALLGLGACSGGDQKIDNQQTIISELTDIVRGNVAAGGAEEVVLTRDLLDQLTVPSLEVVAETRDQTAYLIPFSRRQGVTVWRGVDGAQVVLRQGLVTSTRGIGNDLVSSDYQATLAALRAGRGETTRRLFVRNDLRSEDSLTLQCSLSTLGAVQLEVVGRTYNTTHLREVCATPVGDIVNDYWVERGRSLIRQSRQWVGPKLGYLNLRQLRADTN